MALKITAFMLHSKIWQTMTDLLCPQPDEYHDVPNPKWAPDLFSHHWCRICLGFIQCTQTPGLFRHFHCSTYCNYFLSYFKLVNNFRYIFYCWYIFKDFLRESSGVITVTISLTPSWHYTIKGIWGEWWFTNNTPLVSSGIKRVKISKLCCDIH